MKKHFFIAALVFALLNSCALKPITSDFKFNTVNVEDVSLEKLGNGKVLIYNGSNVLHKVDNTGRLNIWLNDLQLGQLKPGEFVVMELEKKNHKFNLLHLDVVNMRSEHQITVKDSTKVIMVKPTLTSNKLEETNILPKKFKEKFTHVQ